MKGIVLAASMIGGVLAVITGVVLLSGKAAKAEGTIGRDIWVMVVEVNEGKWEKISPPGHCKWLHSEFRYNYSRDTHVFITMECR